MSSQYHVRYFPIDGLNLENNVFDVYEELFFAHPQMPDKNISNAFVILSGPIQMERGGKPWDSDINKKSAENDEKALRKIMTFLACHSLTTKDHYTEIRSTASSGFQLQDKQSLINHISSGGGYRADIKSNKKIFSVEETLQSLINAKSLFAKVDKINDKSLLISLWLYQKSIQRGGNMLQEFLGLITSLESLVSTSNNLKYSFVLRTTALIESDKSKREKVYTILNNAYKLRNKIIHGSEMYAYPYTDPWKRKLELIPIVEKSLCNYIELACDGKNKTDIHDYIDKKLLLGID